LLQAFVDNARLVQPFVAQLVEHKSQNQIFRYYTRPYDAEVCNELVSFSAS